jgi:hypothetical protein
MPEAAAVAALQLTTRGPSMLVAEALAVVAPKPAFLAETAA